MTNLIWDVYEIRSKTDALHGVSLRGRIRKCTIEKGIVCLAENASDEANVVRFALLNTTEPKPIIDFIYTLFPNAVVSKVLEAVENPVLSKVKVNDVSRYSL